MPVSGGTEENAMNTNLVIDLLSDEILRLRQEVTAQSNLLRALDERLADMKTTAPRGPGRPKKATAKRGPGRPRKNS
jgi:uncharacterized coiled-coil protein SlyX